MTHEELILKAKEAKSAEELLAIAKENNVEMTEESANAYFEQLHKSGELSDSELGNVSGGGCHDKNGKLIVTTGHGCHRWACRFCGEKSEKKIHSCPNTKLLYEQKCCDCKHKTYERGLWLCNHPELQE